MSRNDTETPSLCFNSHQDALDFAANCVQDSKHWLAVHNLDLIKGYKEAEIELVFVLCSGSKRD